MLRVLLISHTCQSETEGRPKAECLGRIPDVDLLVLTPDRWRQYGRWRQAAPPPTESGFRLQIGKVSLPWAGPAQNYLHWYPELGETLRRFRPDVIDLWEEPWGLMSVHACRLRNRLLPNTKIVSETEQNIDKRLPFPFERFRAYTLRNADHAVARSEGAAAALRAKGYRGEINVVGNAVDVDLFRPIDRAECRKKFGLEGFVVGYVGRLVESKGLLDLLDAVALLPVGATLLLVGDGPLRSVIEKSAAERGLHQRARVLDAMPPTDVAQAINAMDVLALPSRTTPSWKEQFGRVIIEAHACGVPVIGSDSGAIPNVVGEGGLIAPERRPDLLAAAILKLMDSPDLRRLLGENGRRQVEAKYTWRRVAEQMHAIYRRVAGRDRPWSAAATEAPISFPVEAVRT